MKIEDLHYGDVLRNAFSGTLVMFLALGTDGLGTYVSLAVLLRPRIFGRPDIGADGVVKLHPSHVAGLALVENGPEPLGTAGYRR